MFRVRIMPENKRMVMIDRNEYAAETEKKSSAPLNSDAFI